MNTVFWIAAGNALIVTALFPLLMLLRRWIRNPAVFHILCWLALLKLLTPPLWGPELAWTLPREAAQDASTPSLEAAGHGNSAKGAHRASVTDSVGHATKSAMKATVPTSADFAQSSYAGSTAEPTFALLPSWLVTVWLFGSIVVLVLAITRMFRFRYYLSRCDEAPAEAKQLASKLGRHLGLRRVPRIRFVLGGLSPMLWAMFGRARIIVPTGLWLQLDKAGREALLLHELAHYDRRDHWVRFVEFLATAGYWWHPILWWLRRELRSAEEQCCDAIVVATLPMRRRSYAETIVKALSHVSASPTVPGSIGIRVNANLEQRLSRIMLDEPTPRLSRSVKWLVAVITIGLLPLTPTVAQPPRTNELRFVQEARNSEAPPTVAVRVVTANEQPASGIEVVAFVNGQAWNHTFTSNAQGVIQVPGEWLRKGPWDERRAVLWARDGQSRLGWLDLHQLRQQNPSTLRLALLARDHTVRGKFVDEYGRPLPAVSIVVESLHDTEQNSDSFVRLSRYGDFSRLNNTWNRQSSAKTHEVLQNNPEEWEHYHTLYRESRATWATVPYEEMIRWLLKREGLVVGDFGCGEAKLGEAVADRHEVCSFDHVAINEGVTACDMAHVPLDDDSLNVVVFCLSLMGGNFTDYLREAHRTLKLDGWLHIFESTSRFSDRDSFVRDLKRLGFDQIAMEDRWKFTYIRALKAGRVPNESVELRFQ